MLEHAPLVGLVVAGFALAFVCGVLAQKLRLSPIVGYLAAGIVIGPFTPGYVADTGLSRQLSEIGVILLMFGVGLHFSVADLWRVRGIAIPGALLQIVGATTIGALLAVSWGWGTTSAIVFGISLSVSSTVVLLRALESRHALHTQRAQIVVGWLIVEDIATVLALVMLPVVSHVMYADETPNASSWLSTAQALGWTLAKVAMFVALMLIVGTRAIPKLLGWVAEIHSRELFTLAVLALALGVAFGSSELFGVSLALGAFFAGVVLSESDLSYKAGEDILPLQDAFAVLFFVSVGMLFDWRIVAQAPWQVLAVVAVIVIWKSAAAFLIVSGLGYSIRTALTVAAGDSQIGEFSFILVAVALTLKILPEQAQTLVLAGSIASIAINPFIFGFVPRLEEAIRRRPRLFKILDRSGVRLRNEAAVVPDHWNDHTIVVGYGRVGRVIGAMLETHGMPYAVVEVDRRIVNGLLARNVPVVQGDIADPFVESSVGLQRARLLVFAIPDSFQLRSALARIRTANPKLRVIVRTHDEDDVKLLENLGADLVVMGERELALRMGEYAVELLKSGSPKPIE
jgi:CPA2 family monovalent cation:H+ antiporter-2